jgi:hypothetical protein
VRSRELAADLDGIRAARAVILALPADAPAHAAAASPDCWSLSGCQGLLFHALEHRFSLAQIEAALAALGLEFLGFELPSRSVVDWHRRETLGDPRALAVGLARLRVTASRRVRGDEPVPGACGAALRIRSPG